MAEIKAVARRATPQDHAAFTQSVKSSLANAREKVARVRQTDSQLFLANVISPAAATLIAALAAAIGGNNMFSQAAAQSEDGGWVLACGLVAVFGFIATVSGVFKKQFDDRLVLGNQSWAGCWRLTSQLRVATQAGKRPRKNTARFSRLFRNSSLEHSRNRTIVSASVLNRGC